MRDLARILAGPTVWFVSFCAVYGLHGLICGHNIQGTLAGIDLARGLLVSAFVIALAAQAGMIWLLSATRLAANGPLTAFTSRATAWIGLVASGWTLLPVATTTYCL